MILQAFVYLSIPIGLVGVYFYVRDMFFGTARPNRISFLLWAIAPLIGVAISFHAGAGISLLPVFMAGLNPLIIFVLSFFTKNSYWKLSAVDYVCGGFAVLSLILWLSVDLSVIALICAILCDFFAGIPTMVKAYKDPASESVLLYILGIVNNILGLLILKEWTFTSSAFQIYFILLNAVIALEILRPKLFSSERRAKPIV